MSILYYLENIRLASNGSLENILIVVREFTESYYLYFLVAAIYWTISKEFGRLTIISLILTNMTNLGLKDVIREERPWISNNDFIPSKQAQINATSYAMPAASVEYGVAVFGCLGIKNKNRIFRTIILIYIGLIIFSSFYLGLNTPLDVIVAILAGIISLIIANIIALGTRKDFKYEDILITIALFMICLYFCEIFGYTEASGAAIGVVIGLFMENRFIHFKVEASIPAKIIRIVSGFIVITVLSTHVSPYMVAFFTLGTEDFALYLLIGLYITALHPRFFQYWESKQTKKAILYALYLVLSIAFVIGFIALSDYLKYRAGNIEIIADAGYGVVAPSSSSAAIEYAQQIGASGIKLDVQLTHDDKLVVYDKDNLNDFDLMGSPNRYRLDVLQELNMFDAYNDLITSVSSDAAKAMYDNESMLSLKQAIRGAGDNAGDIYIELHTLDKKHEYKKDIYIDAVIKTVKSGIVLGEVSYISDNYDYLMAIKEKEPDARIVFKATDYLDTPFLDIYPADAYAVDTDFLTQPMIDIIHNYGKKCYADKTNDVEDYYYLAELTVDGVFTSQVGRGRILTRPEYVYMAENYVDSRTMPPLYDSQIFEKYKRYVPQGLTITRDSLIISAYDSRHKKSSVLYVLDARGELINIIELGFKAHAGGLAYDWKRDYLWITASNGQVYALDYSYLQKERIKVRYKFDAGLYNQTGQHVASYLTINEDDLYVGSYLEGKPGLLKKYKISALVDDLNTSPEQVYKVPEKIQGVCIYTDEEGEKTLIMTQCDGYQNSHLLYDKIENGRLDFTNVRHSELIPNMVEQPWIRGNYLYLLFESSADCYRTPTRIPNDQLWLVYFE